ncbi:MAG: DNA mismatch repair endonuclease MutL [Lachnospiraceae bacterium]|jgi:DNA mismatch repair protein MutL|nr:DNA mismatch repair endonuclease MutL [Lachnospiraceae bacterium]
MEIHVLNEDTINKIAAGEVIERPFNVAKELIENSIDAGANAITCEIKDGGVSMLRVTDNGSGIEASQITRAFRRHATSKISEEKDLQDLQTLGFRGEALSSIAAVASVEMITKTPDSLTGIRALNTGLHPTSEDADVIPLEIAEIGAPDGTTVIVRNLFYNVPVRRKFLKSEQTEAGYITELIEHLALSHPDISFHYRINGKEKLHTSGNGDIKELIYRIYGREISGAVLPVTGSGKLGDSEISIHGFIGRPEVSRGTRAFELFFINGRVIENKMLSSALESGYRTDLMQHQFPFAVLYLELPPALVDVNIHPSKREARFTDSPSVFAFVEGAVHRVLHGAELIPKATLRSEKEIRSEDEAARRSGLAADIAEPFEQALRSKQGAAPETAVQSVLPGFPSAAKAVPPVMESAPASSRQSALREENAADSYGFFDDRRKERASAEPDGNAQKSTAPESAADPGTGAVPENAPESTGLSENVPSSSEERRILSPENVTEFRILGQIFRTYWLVAFEDKLLLIDQHAAHEKVMYEHLLSSYRAESAAGAVSQNLMPPAVITFSGREEAVYLQYADVFKAMGYLIEEFGTGSYAIRAVPMELFGNSPERLLRDTIDEVMNEKPNIDPKDILSRIATMSCKAAVKGNTEITEAEVKALIDELLTLEDPYHCPHGRPTMIVLTEQEIEKKFKRIV